MIRTSGRTPCLSLQGMSLLLPQSLQRMPYCSVKTQSPESSGIHTTYSCPVRRGSKAWWWWFHKNSPPGYSVTNTITANRVWTAHPDVWPASLWGCRALCQSSQGSQVGGNLNGLHRGNNHQELPKEQIQVPLLNVTNLQEAIAAESIWGLGPAWYWPGPNGLVSQVSTCSNNHCRTVKWASYPLLKPIKTSIKHKLRLLKPDLTKGCTLLLYFKRDLWLNSSGDELRTTRLWIKHVAHSVLEL